MTNKVDALINQAAAGWAYLELLDELSGTDAYQKQVKQRIKLLMPELEKAINQDIGKMWGCNGQEADRTLYKIINAWKEIMTKVKEVPPHYIPAINEIVTLMLDNPEKLLSIVNEHWPQPDEALVII